ncbi:MAG TPA: gluconate 2-dehydrogenase subunit 3 family protein [Sphingobium sp.]
MLNRRTMLKAASAAGSTGLFVGPAAASAPPPATSTGEAPLTPDELALIAAMAEGIIPKTDTPGAIGAGVPAFFRTIFDEWFLKDQQIAFRASLQAYDNEAKDRFGKGFLACAAADQMQLLVEWDKKGANLFVSPAHPFREFKRLTLHGYYTSEVGQNEELKTVMDAAQDDPNGPVMYGLASMF